MPVVMSVSNDNSTSTVKLMTGVPVVLSAADDIASSAVSN